MIIKQHIRINKNVYFSEMIKSLKKCEKSRYEHDMQRLHFKPFDNILDYTI